MTTEYKHIKDIRSYLSSSEIYNNKALRHAVIDKLNT